MNRIFRRAVLAASALGAVGGIVMTALPASAAPPIRSWGASASGPIHFGQVAPATPFFTPGVASNANYTNFLTTGRIIDRASPSIVLAGGIPAGEPVLPAGDGPG